VDLGTGLNPVVKTTVVGFESTLYFRPMVTVVTELRDGSSLVVISESAVYRYVKEF
jgi:hypothetical protein